MGVVAIVILGALKKCSMNVPDALPPSPPPDFTAFQTFGRVIRYYLIPGVFSSALVFGIMTLICRYGKAKERYVHSMDYRHIGFAFSIICALSLILVGAPTLHVRWAYGIWAGVLFGGPLAFWYFAKTKVEEEDALLVRMAACQLETDIEKLRVSLVESKQKNENLSWQAQTAHEQITRLKEEQKAAAEKKIEETKKKGILDSEDF